MTLQTETRAKLPEFILSRRRSWVEGQPISFLMQQGVENSDVLSLAAGLVDPSTLPAQETLEAAKHLLADPQRGRGVLQYGTTPGAAPLRRVLLEHLSRLENCAANELGVDVDQLILTTGSQQFLSLVGEILLDPGDICLVAAPTYFVFLGLLAGLGAQAIPVTTDEDGLCPDALEAELARLEQNGELHRVKMIYVVSYYENPSGISLSAERRPEIVDIARRWSKSHRLLVLEDAAYRELHYDGPPIPSVWSFDETRESVILTQTFSKSFSPGLRVGFGVVPPELVQPICDRKGNEDFGSANFNQHLIATVLQNGLYRPHLERVKDSYRTKRDAMLSAADRHFADIPGVNWVRPRGGLYVWMTLPERVETGFDSRLFQQATHVEKVMYVPGEICYAGDPEDRLRNQMRLSYGVQDPAGIEEGMRRLANAVRTVVESD
ncbi:MAG: PLP-dependent aminotransferase family protein [Planctomycetaceae bacterium]